jgi:hypothetical protein
MSYWVWVWLKFVLSRFLRSITVWLNCLSLDSLIIYSQLFWTFQIYESFRQGESSDLIFYPQVSFFSFSSALDQSLLSCTRFEPDDHSRLTDGDHNFDGDQSFAICFVLRPDHSFSTLEDAQSWSNLALLSAFHCFMACVLLLASNKKKYLNRIVHGGAPAPHPSSDESALYVRSTVSLTSLPFHSN